MAELTEQERVEREWKSFSKTLAFKQFIEKIDAEDAAAIDAARGPVFTITANGGTNLAFDPQKAIFLLQRSAGYGIVKEYISTYVDLYAE